MAETESSPLCLLLMVCESEFAKRVITILDEMGVGGHTSIDGVFGDGRSGRREDSDIWPGMNRMVFVALPDEALADDIVAHIEQVIADNYRKRPGFAVFKLQGTQIA